MEEVFKQGGSFFRGDFPSPLSIFLLPQLEVRMNFKLSIATLAILLSVVAAVPVPDPANIEVSSCQLSPHLSRISGDSL